MKASTGSRRKTIGRRQRAERAVLDRAAVRIGLVPRRRPACRLQARESRPRLPLRHAREVVRTGEERRRKALCLRQRAIVFGLEIAGQEAAAGRRHDLERREEILKEGLGRAGGGRIWRRGAGPLQAVVRRQRRAQRRPLLGDRPAGPAEGRKSGAVIVGVPAGQISEGERLEPGVPDARRVGGGAPGGEGKKAQEEKG